MKTILIGDIHGCYYEFIAMLDKVKLDTDVDKLILLGDYTDRGPNAYLVVMKIKELKSIMGDRCVLIRGNHEQMLMEYCEYGLSNWMHYRNGGDRTKHDFDENNYDIQEYVDFINENTVLYYQDELFNAVHAGFLYEDVPSNGEYICLWERGAFMSKLYNGKLTFIGHTPIKTPMLSNPEQTQTYKYNKKYTLDVKGLLCIDTGCTFKNCLTGVVISDETMILRKIPYMEEPIA